MRNDDFFTCQSWHWPNARRGVTSYPILVADIHGAVARLAEAAGKWPALKRQAAKGKFADEVLDEMRRVLDVPAFEPDMPWRRDGVIGLDVGNPDQDWVAEKAREFLDWYVRVHGEPKPADKKPETVGAGG